MISRGNGGIVYMLASTLFFSAMNLLIKLLSDIPTMELVFFRCGIALLLCIVDLKIRKIKLHGTNNRLLVLRGVFGTIALYTFFLTLKVLPLGTAVTIQYLSPIFTSIFAIFLLKEKVAWQQWIFYFVSFAGVALIEGFQEFETIFFVGIGIVSALFSGLAYNMVRKLREKEDPIVVVLHFQLIGAISGFGFSLFSWQTPTPVDAVLLLGIGILTFLGQKYLTLALQHSRIGDISIYNYLGIVYALLFGFLFLNEVPDSMMLAGIVLIFIGVIMNYRFTKNNALKLHS